MPYIIEKTFNSEIFTKVGNPTITDDGIASGFSSGNYLKSNIPILNLNGKSFAIYTRINTGNFTQSPTDEVALYGNTEHNRYSPQLQLYKHGNSIWGAVGIDGGASWASVQINNISPALLENTYYYFKQVYNAQANTLTIGFSSDGVVWNEKTETLNSSPYWVEQIEIGADQNANFLTGSIDLNAFKIIVDGKVVLNGTTPKVVYVLPSIQEIKDYYSNTLIVQYNGKPKAKATIEMLVELVYSNMLLMQIRDAFDWRTAVGEQLDIIGKWVGVSRIFNINLITSPKLAYPQYSRLLPVDETSALQGGYSDYYTFDDDNGGQLRYNDLQSVTNSLNDDNYRIIIGLKIIYNSINHTAGEIDKAIWEYFGGEVITKWTDNTLTYEYPSKYAQIIAFADYKGVLPAPIGVTVQLRLI